MSGTTVPAPGTPLLMQKSSFAGYFGIGAYVLNTLANTGIPHSLSDWLGLFSVLIPSVAAIVTNENGPAISTPPKS